MNRLARYCILVTLTAASTNAMMCASQEQGAVPLQRKTEMQGVLRSVQTSSGVLCVITKHGSGRQPKPGEIVTVHATALLMDGKEFRHPKLRDDPDWFWLLPDRQPVGVIEGMGQLHVGDSAVLVVPPALGYGERGKGLVPPNATLVYLIDLLDVKSKELGDTLLDLIDSEGIETALQRYGQLKANGFRDVHVDEIQLNGIGYLLLRRGDLKSAVQIFAINTDLYPYSANAYDSLAEAYVANGQKQLAVQAYQKALSIDPGLESAQGALIKLEH